MEKENNEPQLLGYRRKAAAAYLREVYGVPCSEGWLAKLAVSGNGPPFRRYARYPFYSQSDLELVGPRANVGAGAQHRWVAASRQSRRSTA